MEKLITKKQLRELFGGVSDMTVHRWLVAGSIPPPIRRPGMHPRWRLSDLENIMK